MCFAPQRRTLFRHLNFQKWSEPLIFLRVWLQNVLRTTTVCKKSTSQLPKVVRRWYILYILISKCTSRYNGMHFIDKLPCKAAPQNCPCFPKLLRKAFPQSCSLKRFPATTSQKWCPKHHHKANAQSYYVSNVFPKGLPLQSGSQKLLPKLLPTAAPQSCVLKLVVKAAPQGWNFLKLLLEATAQSCSCSPNMLHKAVPQSPSPKFISNVTPHGYFPILQTRKLLLKTPPRNWL